MNIYQKKSKIKRYYDLEKEETEKDNNSLDPRNKFIELLNYIIKQSQYYYELGTNLTIEWYFLEGEIQCNSTCQQNHVNEDLNFIP